LEEQIILTSDKRSGNLFESSVSISNREGDAFVDITYPLLYGLRKELPSIYFDIEELLPESIHKQSSATYVFLRVLAELNFREKLLKSFDRQSTKDVQFVPVNGGRYDYNPISQYSRVTNPMNKGDSMTLSDEDSCYNVVMNNYNVGREPPTQTLDTTVNVEEDNEDHDMLNIGNT